MANSDTTLSVLIEIQSQLAGLTATVSGMAGLESGAGAAASALELVNAQLSAAGANTSGIGSVRAALSDATATGHDFFESLKAGFALDVAGRLSGQIVGIGEAFKAALNEGVHYNAQMQTGTLGLAAALRSVEPGKYLNFQQAQNAAGIAMDLIRQRANAAGLDVHAVMEAQSADLKALVDGGITDTGQQLDVVTGLIGAAATKGITGVQALRDSIDILNGRAGNIVLAKELGLESDALKEAAANGTLYALIMSKLVGYREAMASQAASYQGVMQTLRNETEALEGEAAKPIFEVMQRGVAALNKDLQSNGGLAGELRDVGRAAGEVVSAGVGVTRWAAQNAGAIAGVSRVVIDLVAGLALLKAGQFALGGANALRGMALGRAAAYNAEQAAVATAKWAAAQNAQAAAAEKAAAWEARLAAVRQEADAAAKLYGQYAGGGYQGEKPEMFGPAVPNVAQFSQMEQAAEQAANGVSAKFRGAFAAISAEAKTMGSAILSAVGPVTLAFLAAEAIYALVDRELAAAEKREQGVLDLIRQGRADVEEFKRDVATVDTAPARDALLAKLGERLQELRAARDDAKQAADELSKKVASESSWNQARDAAHLVSLRETLSLREGELGILGRLWDKTQSLSGEELNRRSINQAIAAEMENQDRSLTDMVAKLPSLIKGMRDAADQAAFANQMASAANSTARVGLLQGRQNDLVTKAATLNLKAGGSADAVIGSADDVTDAVQSAQNRIGANQGKVPTEQLQATQELVDLQKELLANQGQLDSETRSRTQELEKQKATEDASKQGIADHLRTNDALLRGDKAAADQIKDEVKIRETAAQLMREQTSLTQEQATAIATKVVTGDRAVADAAKGATAAKKEGLAADREALNVAKEQASLQREIEQDKLKEIEGAGSRVQSDPFLFDESKARLMAGIYQEQVQQIRQIIDLDARRAALERGSTDPGVAAQYRADTKEISTMGLALAKVAQEQKQLSVSGTMQKSLTAWVNQFGTAAQQAGHAVTNVLGHAVDGMSNAITGLILHTTTLKQAFSQMATAIIGDLVKMAVEFVVQRAVMFVANELFSRADASTANSQASTAASAWAPAAVAASTASYGVAAGVGLASTLAAMASGAAAGAAMSSVGGGYAAGGYTGDGAIHEVAGVVHRGEYVIDKGTLHRAGGPAAFDAMRMRLSSTNPNRATAGNGPASVGGGRAAGSARQRNAEIHNNIAVVRDRSELLNHFNSSKGQMQIISATRKHRAKIGIKI